MDGLSVTFREHKYTLLFNGNARFDIADLIGLDGFSAKICEDSREGLDALCEAATIMFEQGELSRRHAGLDSASYPSKDTLRQTLLPVEIMNLRKAVLDAYGQGYGREVENVEIDLALAEFQKKTE